MNTSLNKAATCFGLFDGDKIVGFQAVLHFPHPSAKNIKKGHRLVIHPDYQGIGLGFKFRTEVAKYYKSLGFRFFMTTSAKNLLQKLARSPEWRMMRFGRTHHPGSASIASFAKSHRYYCPTGSFEFVGRSPAFTSRQVAE